MSLFLGPAAQLRLTSRPDRSTRGSVRSGPWSREDTCRACLSAAFPYLRGTLLVAGLRLDIVSKSWPFVPGLGTGILRLRFLSDDDDGDGQGRGNNAWKKVVFAISAPSPRLAPV